MALKEPYEYLLEKPMSVHCRQSLWEISTLWYSAKICQRH